MAARYAAFFDTISLNQPAPAYDDSEEALSLEDVVVDDRPGPEDILHCKQLRSLCVKAFRRLPSAQRRAVYMHFRKGFNQAKIANDLGVSTSAVSQAISKGVAGMRAFILPKLVYAVA
jgi:DNA-directed RNA polymerase specialized sigma24 family protein